MRKIVPFILVVALLSTASCSSTETSEGLDAPVPFPSYSADSFPSFLDQNSNGRSDFYTRFISQGNQFRVSHSFILGALSKNGYLRKGEAERFFLNPGEEIGPHPYYLEDPTATTAYFGSIGVCSGNTDNEKQRIIWSCGELEEEKQYIGLRVESDNGMLYGWALIGAGSKERSASVTLYDIAFASETGEPIQVGEHL